MPIKIVYRLKQVKFFRFLICAIRMPFVFIHLRGHIAKSGALSVDAKGNYVPWLTYPFIDFIENLDLSDCSVFEFGSGSSTFWWSERVKNVVSVEMDSSWFDFIYSRRPSNVEIALCQNGGEYPHAINATVNNFDIIVVDGAERYKSATCAIQKLSEEGVIILDNCDWYPNAATMLRSNGFVQLDFYGFSPNNSFPSITSLFYKNNTLLKKRKYEMNPVIGGNTIPGGVLDDC